MEKNIIATGKTIDLAIESALTQLGLDRDSVSVQVIQQAKQGFLGFGSQPAALHQLIGKVSDESALNTVVINALLENAQFKDQMIKRLVWHLENTYAPERVIAHIDAMAAEVNNDIQYDYALWDSTYERWQEHVQFLRDFVKSEENDRVATMVESAQRAFKLSDAEMENYFGDLYPTN